MNNDEKSILDPYGHGHNTQTLIIRVWRDPGERNQGASSWRGRIEVVHPDNAKDSTTETFKTIEELFDIIKKRLPSN